MGIVIYDLVLRVVFGSDPNLSPYASGGVPDRWLSI
jgi:hypothetical protein